jgi:hypothetical protein
MDVMMKLSPFVGKYVDVEWVQKNIWKFTDEEIEKIANNQMIDIQKNAQMQSIAIATQEKFGLLPDPAAPPQNPAGT